MNFRAVVCCLVATVFSGVFSANAEALKGAWVASVYNLNFPARVGLSAETQKAQIRQIVAAAARSGLNALMVQVRPESDALYSSRLEPWSRYLTGKQGAAPGYDPLDYFIRVGREQGVGIHAWINPYRAAANASEARAGNHVSRQLAGAVHRIGNALWLDPGDPAVQGTCSQCGSRYCRTLPGCRNRPGRLLLSLPQPQLSKGSFPDRAFYARYGGNTDLGDWRRQNINKLIRQLHDTVKGVRPDVLFGVSPFGIYRKGFPSNVTVELDQYQDLYADPVAWLRNGWVDYLSPQLYWRDKSAQSFSALLEWWRSPGG